MSLVVTQQWAIGLVRLWFVGDAGYWTCVVETLNDGQCYTVVGGNTLDEVIEGLRWV